MILIRESLENFIKKISKRIDWLLVLFVLPIVLSGLFTMKSFIPDNGTNNFFGKQVIWIILSLVIFFIFSFIDFGSLKRKIGRAHV